MKKYLSAITGAAMLLGGAQAATAESAKLAEVKERGNLRCSAHNGSYLGFAEVDDQGNWSGLDISLCRALATAIFGTDEGHLELVPISWAQRWPALQSGDIDAVIKTSGWTMSRDTELNLSYSRPYFIGAFQVMAHKELGAESVADLDGGSICAPAGTSTERAMAGFLDANNIDAELVVFEKTEEVNGSYYSGRCDAMVEFAPALATARTDADDPEAHVILPDVVNLEAESIIVSEGDEDWLDIMNWMLTALWLAEQEGVTSANVDEMKANPPSPEIASLLGVNPGIGDRLGLSNDWAYNVIKNVGNFAEIYDSTIGKDSPYQLNRGINALWNAGGVHFPLIID